MRTTTRLSTVAALGATLLAAACGSSNKTSSTDSRVSDTSLDIDGGPPDAAPVPTRHGTLAVVDVNETDPAVASAAIGGAQISLAFEDLTKNDGGKVLLDETQGSGIGGCIVTQYDAGASAAHLPHPLVDEGPITIDGTGLKEPGPYTCAFAGGSYLCDGGPQKAQTGQVGSYNTAPPNTTLTFTNQTFASTDIGKVLILSGFSDANYNHAFPIVTVTGGHPVIYTPGVPVTAGDINFPSGGVSYDVVQGAGPVPNGAVIDDFVDVASANDHVTLAAAANADYPVALAASADPIGKGIMLDGPSSGGNCDDCAQPYEIPASAANNVTVSFACDPTQGDMKGTCGDDDTALLRGFVISGTTTDGTLTGLAPYEMPAPKTSYASFVCTFVGVQKGKMSNAAIAAILSTDPTRVETTVFRVGFAQSPSSSVNSWNYVTGHGLVGHTDIN